MGAVRGLISTLTALLSAPDTTHIAVAFDTVIESFRNRLFAGYKTGDGIDPNLLRQFALAEQATRALGIVTWSMVEFECDDALAAAAHRFAADARVQQVVICSPDKDLCQCVVGDRVVVLDRMRKVQLNADGVRAKHGVNPHAIPDLLALVGDDADGIPGIDGFGAKTAAALLMHYGSLEAIPDDGWAVKVRGADKLVATLRAARADAALYKVLATLRTDVPLAQDLDALRYLGPDDSALSAVGAALADERLVTRTHERLAMKRT